MKCNRCEARVKKSETKKGTCRKCWGESFDDPPAKMGRPVTIGERKRLGAEYAMADVEIIEAVQKERKANGEDNSSVQAILREALKPWAAKQRKRLGILLEN